MHIYIYFMKQVVKFAIVIKEILESEENVTVFFWGPYILTCLQLVKSCFKSDFILCLYE